VSSQVDVLIIESSYIRLQQLFNALPTTLEGMQHATPTARASLYALRPLLGGHGSGDSPMWLFPAPKLYV
jgi:hypothetical protein